MEKEKNVVKLTVRYGEYYTEKIKVIIFGKKEKLKILIKGDATKIPQPFWKLIYNKFGGAFQCEFITIDGQMYFKRESCIQEFTPKKGGFLDLKKIMYFYNNSQYGHILIDGWPWEEEEGMWR